MMDKNNGNPMIFTTGAFLSPKEWIAADGSKSWGWIVEEFTEDSYRDGKIFNPQEFANTKAELLCEHYEH